MAITVKDVFPPPPGGWTCFHCGETFRAVALAMDHFGVEAAATPACRIKVGDERNLVTRIRELEEQLGRYRREDTDKDREYHALVAKHVVALREAEQTGYDKGVADARALTPTP